MAAHKPRIQCPRRSFSNGSGAKYCDQCGTRLTADHSNASAENLNSLQQSTPQVVRGKIKIVKTHMEGERKPVAILFTDIVDSTSLAER